MLERGLRQQSGFLRRQVERSLRGRQEIRAVPVAAPGRPVPPWPVKDADLLAELSERLAEHIEDLSATWAQRLLVQLGPTTNGSSSALETIAWVNTWYLEDHLTLLRARRVDAVVQENFDRHLRLLRSQRDSAPEHRLTLPQLYLSLEISASIFSEWAQSLFATDPRLPAILAAIGRLTLHLGQAVSQAFHEVRSEELHEAVRVSTALHEASFELNVRSASAGNVVAHLARMVARVLGCKRSLTFLWLPDEGAYAPAHGFGFSAEEMRELTAVRFRPGDVPIMDHLLAGETVSGTRDDGRVSREMMERYDSHSYALAPLVGSRRGPLGILAAYRAEAVPFSAADLRILDGVAQNAALALENARLVEQLEAAAQLKGEFINSMSHEMRTPLNVIFGYLEMLREEVDADGQGPMLLDRVHRNAGHLVKLVNTLLDIGRIDTGRMPINVETFHVEHLFDDLQQVFTPLAETRGLVFECAADGALGELTTDRLKLVEILNNLLANAFKFTDAGRIGLRARLSESGDRVRFEVADTGIGIEPAAVPVVFDLFRQAGASDRGGTGLGLYIVKRLTELLRGDIAVDSNPGRGSCFAVEIPRILAA